MPSRRPFPAPTVLLLAAALATAAAHAQTPSDEPIVQAREAHQKRNAAQLAQLAQATQRQGHPLASWVAYWELNARLATAQQPELDAFAARWAGTYVEDRLRNDWLLELGKRRDWANFRVEFPRFRMNDDREVTCYALLVQHQDGQDVRAAARAAWLAQREADDGCQLMAGTLHEARVLPEADLWLKARLMVDANRLSAARAAVTLIGPALERQLGEVLDNPARFLDRRAHPAGMAHFEMEVLALVRLAAREPEDAAARLEGAWSRTLPLSLQAQAWAHVARQAALKQMPEAVAWSQRAWKAWDGAARPGTPAPFTDEQLAWQVRAAVRATEPDRTRWQLVQRAVDAMSPAERSDAAWVYWRARSQLALARPGAEGEPERAAALQALAGIAHPLHFYGQLALAERGERLALPAAPAPLSTEERAAAQQRPGLQRGLRLIEAGLRSEGVREWNFTLRGLAERELLAAAQLACERAVWDRCINTSERTRSEIDIAQRYPMPERELITGTARRTGLDPAVVYGLIRQESRFITDARSHVGASGLMQLMPATARATARQIGLNYTPQMINDREINLQLGTAYLKRVLDDFEGSLAMATAAYNAGPGRPRRWREGVVVDAAAWAEGIPFNETRDYVKKVLSNAVVYSGVLGQPLPPLRALLGATIGPRDPAAPAPDRNIP